MISRDDRVARYSVIDVTEVEAQQLQHVGNVLVVCHGVFLGSREIGGVKPSDAKEWAQRMKSKGFAYSTISNHKRSLKATFYLAIADDCIRKNPFDFKLATVIKRDVTEREPLSREQVDALLGFMRSDAVYHRYTDEVVIRPRDGAAHIGDVRG